MAKISDITTILGRAGKFDIAPSEPATDEFRIEERKAAAVLREIDREGIFLVLEEIQYEWLSGHEPSGAEHHG